MPYLYQEFKDGLGERRSIRRLSDGASIMLDPDNLDYQEFLRLASLQGESNILEAAE